MIIEQREIDEIVESERLSKNQLYLSEISERQYS